MEVVFAKIPGVTATAVGNEGGKTQVVTRIEPAHTFWRAEDYHQ